MIGSQASWLYPFIDRHLTLIVLTLLMAVTSVFIPHCQTVSIANLVLLLNGIGGGAWDSSNTILLVDLWPDATASILQVNQFMMSLGMTLTGGFVQSLTHSENSISLPFITNGVLQAIGEFGLSYIKQF